MKAQNFSYQFTNFSSLKVTRLFFIFIIINQFNTIDDDRFYCSTDTNRQMRFLDIKKQKIGSGTYGVIYGDGNHVLKTQKIENTNTDIAYMNREISGMIAFDDINIVATESQGCWLQKSGVYLNVWLKLKQYSGNLKAYQELDFLKNKYWQIDMAFKIFSTMKKIHDRGLCHFDLKQGNIFQMNRYTPVIGDLGLMRSLAIAKRTNFFGGTPYFLGKKATQQERFTHYDNCSPDLFALGVILYDMIVGLQSFVNSSNVTTALTENPDNEGLRILAPLMKKLLNETNPSLRENITKNLQFITKEIQKLMQDEVTGPEFQQYLDDELNYYQNVNSQNASSTTLYFQNQLIEQFQNRRAIYEMTDDQSTLNALQQYCQAKYYPGIFGKNYLQKSPDHNRLGRLDQPDQVDEQIDEQVIQPEKKIARAKTIKPQMQPAKYIPAANNLDVILENKKPNVKNPVRNYDKPWAIKKKMIQII